MLAAQDHLDILMLYEEYNRAVDAGDGVAWAATYVEDGVFERPNGIIKGRAGLVEFVNGRAAGASQQAVVEQRHWNAAIAIAGDGARAQGSCQLLLSGVASDTRKPVVLLTGSYVDTLVKGPTGWRFAHRIVRTG